MVKNLAVIFGVVLLVIGIAGFIPALTPSGMLFGIFAVDAMHNTLHLLTGAIALAVGLSSERASTVYFQIFGVFYAILAIMGFAHGGTGMVLSMANNYADAGLHLLIAVATLYIGFIHSHMQWRGSHWPHWRH